MGGYGRTGDLRHTVLTQVFSTVTSPVFSELAIVVTSDAVMKLPWDAALFKTLRKMNEIRPFRLAFLPDASAFHREKLQRELWGALSLATAQGFLDFSIQTHYSLSMTGTDKAPPQTLQGTKCNGGPTVE